MATSKISKVLQEALDKFEGGKRWIKGNWKQKDTKHGGFCYCSDGALQAATNRRSYMAYDRAETYLRNELSKMVSYPENSIIRYNDSEDTKWRNIKSLFTKAIKAAQKDEMKVVTAKAKKA